MDRQSQQFDFAQVEDPAVARSFDALRAALEGGDYCQAMLKRETLHLPGILSGLEHGFPAIADVEEALEQGAFLAGDLRVSSGREILDLEQFRYVNRGKIEPQMLANAALMGSSIVFNYLERRILRAHFLARLLEGWLGDAIELILVTSFGEVGAFLPHHDEEHVILIQLDGMKHWTLLGEPVAPGAPMTMDKEPGPPRQLTMKKGDVLYLPAGQRHICHTEGYSVHLGILCQAATGIILRQRLEMALKASVVLQEPVPAILGFENDRLMAQEFRNHLHALIDQLDIEEIFAQERKHLRIRPRVRLLKAGPANNSPAGMRPVQ